jgi:hypothetical protein
VRAHTHTHTHKERKKFVELYGDFSRRLIGGKQNSSLEKDKDKVPLEPAVPMECR